MSKPIKTPTLKEIDKKIDEFSKLKATLNKYTNQESKNVQEEILIKYLELQRVDKVAGYLNEIGYKINGRKYISNDVSNLFKSSPEVKDIDMNLHEFAKKIFEYNKGKATWNALLKLC